jgi:Cation transporter/ATPase, N-terminus
MKIQQLSVQEAIQSLHSGNAGLTAAQMERRLRDFGPKRMERVQGKSW